MMGSYAALEGLRNAAIAMALAQQHIPADQIGINGLGQCVAMLAVAVFLPRIIHRIGCRITCIVALLFEGIAVSVLAIFDSLTIWFIGRMLLGCATAMLFTAGETWIGGLAIDEYRGKVMGLYTAFLGGGLSLGPALHSLGALLCIPTFALIPVLIIVSGTPLLFLSHTQGAGQLETVQYSLRDFLLQTPLVSILFILIGMKDTAQSTFLPLLGVQIGLSDTAYTLLLASCLLGGVTIPIFLGTICDKVSKKSLLCGISFTFGVCALFLLMTLPYPAPRLINCFFLGGLGSSIFSVAMALIGDQFTGSERVTAYVGTGALWGVGSLGGNILVGAAMDTFYSIGFVLILGIPFILFSGAMLGSEFPLRRASI